MAGLALIAGVAALVLALGNRDSASKSDVDKLSSEVTTLQQQASTTGQEAQAKVDQAIAKLKAVESGSGAGSIKKRQDAMNAQIEKIRAYLKPYGGP